KLNGPARMRVETRKFIEYLRSVKNASPHTISNYGNDLGQFVEFLTPPESRTPPITDVTHHVIREYVGHLHDQGLEKSSMARKLASVRSFFKFCVREGWLRENPARLVPTPKLPKRIPSVLSAEEMNGFLNQVAGMHSANSPGRRPARQSNAENETLLLKRDRAL